MNLFLVKALPELKKTTFDRDYATLLKHCPGKYVAHHKGENYAIGDTSIEAAENFSDEFGVIPEPSIVRIEPRRPT